MSTGTAAVLSSEKRLTQSATCPLASDPAAGAAPRILTWWLVAGAARASANHARFIANESRLAPASCLGAEGVTRACIPYCACLIRCGARGRARIRISNECLLAPPHVYSFSYRRLLARLPHINPTSQRATREAKGRLAHIQPWRPRCRRAHASPRASSSGARASTSRPERGTRDAPVQLRSAYQQPAANRRSPPTTRGRESRPGREQRRRRGFKPQAFLELLFPISDTPTESSGAPWRRRRAASGERRAPRRAARREAPPATRALPFPQPPASPGHVPHAQLNPTEAGWGRGERLGRYWVGARQPRDQLRRDTRDGRGTRLPGHRYAAAMTARGSERQGRARLTGRAGEASPALTCR